MSRNRITTALIAFAGLAFNPAVSGQLEGTAWVRHAPTLNGRVEGSVQVMAAESLALNGNAVLTGDLLVPGVPTVEMKGHGFCGGIVDGAGSGDPAGYRVTITGDASLRCLIRRSDPRPLAAVDPPPPPAGVRRVVLDRRSQDAGDFGTVRDLALREGAGLVPVAAGSYGTFTADHGTGFVLGVPGATAPAGYSFEKLTLNGGSSLSVVGPVQVTIGGNLAITARTIIGTASHPEWLTLRLAGGGLTMAGHAAVYAHLEAPAGTVTLNGGSELNGLVTCDRLVANGNSLLRLSAAAANQPPWVELSSPADGATFCAPASLLLAATASDSDGAVSRVEFLQGATKLGEDSSAPYELLWANVPAGTYTLTAVATDNAGAAAVSTAATITVATPSNQPPTVALESPPDGAVFATPATIHLAAAAHDPDGVVTVVEFHHGTSKIGEARHPPFALDWFNVAPGGYALTATATDNAGATATSAPVVVSVATGMPFATDFEVSEGYSAGPLDGQGGWLADDASVVTNADAQHGEQSVLVPPGIPGRQIGHEFPDAIEGAVTFVDFHVLVAAGSEAGSGGCFESEVAKLALVQSGEGAVFQVFDGDGSGGGIWKTTGGLIVIDAEGRATDWHRLTIRTDYPARKWDLYLDGEMIAADVGFRDNSCGAFSTFAGFGHPTAATLLDNFLAGYDNPLFADADKDGLPDAWETANGLDPSVDDRHGDKDGDGLCNLHEYRLGTRADLADSDVDGMPDGWELEYGLNPTVSDAEGDPDGDGMTSLLEYRYGRNPAKGVVPDADGVVNLRVDLPAS